MIPFIFTGGSGVHKVFLNSLMKPELTQQFTLKDSESSVCEEQMPQTLKLSKRHVHIIFHFMDFSMEQLHGIIGW